jgi:hypothetical protein
VRPDNLVNPQVWDTPARQRRMKEAGVEFA